MAEKIDIRMLLWLFSATGLIDRGLLGNYVMQYLVSKAKADGYVPSTLAQLLCRITKLGWFDSPELKSTIDLTIKMIQSSPQYYGVGMLILGQMVQEINQPGSTRQYVLLFVCVCGGEPPVLMEDLSLGCKGTERSRPRLGKTTCCPSFSSD